MADPAFAQKMAIEQLLAASSNLYWEYRQRGDRFFKCAAPPVSTCTTTVTLPAQCWSRSCMPSTCSGPPGMHPEKFTSCPPF